MARTVLQSGRRAAALIYGKYSRNDAVWRIFRNLQSSNELRTFYVDRCNTQM